MRYIREGRLLRGYHHLTGTGRAVSIVDGVPVEWSYSKKCAECGSFRRVPYRGEANCYTYSAICADDCEARTDELPGQCKCIDGFARYAIDMNEHLKKWGKIL